mmetsp:Transcript_27629/g.71061  ORF Transcript_27629/g.71061 Transcript_27629/m.71061 type:complete len:273 (-) Transcript_27629:94-912(-)
MSLSLGGCAIQGQHRRRRHLAHRRYAPRRDVIGRRRRRAACARKRERQPPLQRCEQQAQRGGAQHEQVHPLGHQPQPLGVRQQQEGELADLPQPRAHQHRRPPAAPARLYHSRCDEHLGEQQRHAGQEQQLHVHPQEVRLHHHANARKEEGRKEVPHGLDRLHDLMRERAVGQHQPAHKCAHLDAEAQLLAGQRHKQALGDDGQLEQLRGAGRQAAQSRQQARHRHRRQQPRAQQEACQLGHLGAGGAGDCAQVGAAVGGRKRRHDGQDQPH